MRYEFINTHIQIKEYSNNNISCHYYLVNDNDIIIYYKYTYYNILK